MGNLSPRGLFRNSDWFSVASIVIGGCLLSLAAVMFGVLLR